MIFADFHSDGNKPVCIDKFIIWVNGGAILVAESLSNHGGKP